VAVTADFDAGRIVDDTPTPISRSVACWLGVVVITFTIDQVGVDGGETNEQ
jgi:hypothetical protein